jgi:beta-glucosidase/6-phospho-beta-glucosidase/beta-galactosidase
MRTAILKFELLTRASVVVFAICITTIVHAQSSIDRSRENPKETYFSLKRSFERTQARSKVYIADSKVTSLAPCLDAADAFGATMSQEDLLGVAVAELANELVYLRVVLGTYPSRLWRDWIAEYESKRLIEISNTDWESLRKKRQAEIESSPKSDNETAESSVSAQEPEFESEFEKIAKQALTKKLKDYNRDHKHRREVFAGMEGCGGDGVVSVSLVAIPDARRIQYISVHLFSLCKDQAYDPLDQVRCPRWQDYSETALLSGRYKVLVTWTDGNLALRDLDVDAIKEDKDGVRKLSIRK